MREVLRDGVVGDATQACSVFDEDPIATGLGGASFRGDEANFRVSLLMDLRGAADDEVAGDGRPTMKDDVAWTLDPDRTFDGGMAQVGGESDVDFELGFLGAKGRQSAG